MGSEVLTKTTRLTKRVDFGAKYAGRKESERCPRGAARGEPGCGACARVDFDLNLEVVEPYSALLCARHPKKRKKSREGRRARLRGETRFVRCECRD
jgi:hypothetical protein